MVLQLLYLDENPNYNLGETAFVSEVNKGSPMLKNSGLLIFHVAYPVLLLYTYYLGFINIFLIFPYEL